MKKIVFIFLLVLNLSSCYKKEENSVALSKGMITSIDSSAITITLESPIPRIDKRNIQKQYVMDSNTLFLENGHIIKKESIQLGQIIIYSEKDNKIITAEILSSD